MGQFCDVRETTNIVLFCSLLYKLISCCLGNAIFFSGSQKLIFNNNQLLLECTTSQINCPGVAKNANTRYLSSFPFIYLPLPVALCTAATLRAAATTADTAAAAVLPPCCRQRRAGALPPPLTLRCCSAATAADAAPPPSCRRAGQQFHHSTVLSVVREQVSLADTCV